MVDECVHFLREYSRECGGPLIVTPMEFVSNRANLIGASLFCFFFFCTSFLMIINKVKLPGVNPKRWVTFAGMHMDVVPANCDDWTHDPYTFRRDGDVLYGRGVTDCLGCVFQQQKNDQHILTDMLLKACCACHNASRRSRQAASFWSSA